MSSQAPESKKIRVLLVDDSPIVLAILQRILKTASDMEVVGTAGDGEDALRKIESLKPTVVCTDLHMPRMNGLELTRAIVQRAPLPILVISTAVQKEDERNVFELLRAGAVDVYPKPRGAFQLDEKQIAELLHKIRVIAGVRVITRAPQRAEPPAEALPPVAVDRAGTMTRLVALGASTGGPQVYAAILAKLPKNFPVPVLCVQHISLGFLNGLVDWLDAQSPLKVVVAKNGEAPQAGKVYFPAEDTHLEVSPEGMLRCVTSEPRGGFRPSVNVLFESVARVYGRSALGVLMTGMGNDGATGLKAIADAGGWTIAQDEKTSVVFGMPREAIALGAAREIVAMGDIVSAIVRRVPGA